MSDQMHAARVADVNARIRDEGRCVLHNPEVHRPALYLLRTPIGNELPLCADCCAWWREDAAGQPDYSEIQPVWIKSL